MTRRAALLLRLGAGVAQAQEIKLSCQPDGGGPIAIALAVAGDTFWRLRLDLATLLGMVFDRDGGETIRCRNEDG